MYQDYFHLSDKPFSIAPNPHYLYLSDQHREALAHLSYGLHEYGGFIVLTGEVGTGKTTVCRCLLEQIPPEVRLAMIFNPSFSEKEMLQSICGEFGVSCPGDASIKDLSDCLNRYLLQQHAQGKHAVLIIEEAQNLNAQLLEQLRLLTNLESNERKLLQIMLIGQPELLDKLELPELRQLSQRIVARFHLQSLNRKEVQAYISHRLMVAGCHRALFPPAVVAAIARLSGGIPRVINLLCDRTLLGCYTQNKEKADMTTTLQAAREVLGKKRARSSAPAALALPWRHPRHAMAFSIAATALVITTFFYGLDPIKQMVSRTANAGSAWIELPEKIPIPPSRPTEAVSISNGEGAAMKPKARSASALLTTSAVMAKQRSEWDAYLLALRLWGVELGDQPGDVSPCQLLTRYSLDCWHKKGDYSDLIRLNRPAVLKLHDRRGNFFYGVVTQLDGKEVRLSFMDGDWLIPIERLNSVWTDEYTVLWKRPSGFSKTIRPGDRSPVVAWLLDQLPHTSRFSQRSGQASRMYDRQVMNWVSELQGRCQLSVDGLLGKETIIRLNGLTAQVPRLADKPDHACRAYYRG